MYEIPNNELLSSIVLLKSLYLSYCFYKYLEGRTVFLYVSWLRQTFFFSLNFSSHTYFLIYLAQVQRLTPSMNLDHSNFLQRKPMVVSAASTP